MRQIHALIVLALVLLPTKAWPLVPADPVFAAVWGVKDPGGTGGLFYDLTWDELVARWRELGGRNQHLVDVEAYRRASEWRYIAAWRVGPRHGALFLAPWEEFVKFWNQVKDTQELVDLEIVGEGADRKFLGVWN